MSFETAADTNALPLRDTPANSLPMPASTQSMLAVPVLPASFLPLCQACPVAPTCSPTSLACSELTHLLSRGAPCPLFPSHITLPGTLIVITLRCHSKSFPPRSLLWLVLPNSYLLLVRTLLELDYWMQWCSTTTSCGDICFPNGCTGNSQKQEGAPACPLSLVQCLSQCWEGGSLDC